MKSVLPLTAERSWTWWSVFGSSVGVQEMANWVCLALLVAGCDSRSRRNFKRFNGWKHGCCAAVDGCWSSSSLEATSAACCYFDFRFWVHMVRTRIFQLRDKVVFAFWSFYAAKTILKRFRFVLSFSVSPSFRCLFLSFRFVSVFTHFSVFVSVLVNGFISFPLTDISVFVNGSNTTGRYCGANWRCMRFLLCRLYEKTKEGRTESSIENITQGLLSNSHGKGL